MVAEPKVLLLDDDATIGFLGKMVLSQARFDVTLATSAEELWRIIEKFFPDIFLLDLELPDGNGVEICQKLRSLSQFSQTPILMITGHDEQEAVVDALASGATDFMSKPLNWYLLVQRVRYMWRSHLVLIKAQENQRLLVRAQAVAKTGSWEKVLASGGVTASDQFLLMVEHGNATSDNLLELFLASVVPDDQEFVSKKIDAALELKESQTFEHRMLAGGKSVIFVRHVIELRLDPVSGKPVALCGTIQDITEEKKRALLEQDRIRLLEMGIKNASMEDLYSAFFDLIEHQINGSHGLYFWKADETWKCCYTSEESLCPMAESLELCLQGEDFQKKLNKESSKIFFVIKATDLCVFAKQDTLALVIPLSFREKSEVNCLFVVLIEEDHPSLLDQPLLERFFINVAGLIRLLTNNYHLSRELRYQAYHDSLTGLGNRFFFFESFKKILEKKDGQKRALILINIDRFKSINDSLGHNVGDRILCEIASRLQKIVQEGDLLAHLSGDEFIIFTAPFVDREDIEKKILQVVEALGQPFKENNYQVNLSGRCGVALYPQHSADADQLFQYADIAVFHSKKKGAGSWTYYNAEGMGDFVQKLAMENEMKLGLERDEFYLLFQPQVLSKTRKIIGYEALLRWNRPDGVFIPPDVFISIAEQSGFIVPLGTWVLEKACREILRLHENGSPHIRVAVNVSTVQFIQDNFVDIVKEILEKTGFPPERLELEVTEGTVMHDISVVASRLEELREMGVTIAVDDFGTGYSSLSYLKFLPINCLKIDRSFIMALGSDEEDHQKTEAVVDSLIRMAENLGLEVVAEGVETPEQLEYLAKRNCTYIQGYLTGKPGRLLIE